MISWSKNNELYYLLSKFLVPIAAPFKEGGFGFTPTAEHIGLKCIVFSEVKFEVFGWHVFTQSDRSNNVTID